MADFEPTTPVRKSPEDLAPGELVGGRYRLERRIGVGGMAAVWLATDERLGRRVAVKAMADGMGRDGEYRQRFRREAKLAARLQHPNLVGVYDYHAGERPYLVMEYVDGGTLAERLAAGDAPPVERLARELLAALRCIHTAGVLHRDVKPQNVLVDRAGRARLSDFGIASASDSTSITRTGIVIGTETYLAPERRRGEHASERSDLYSLGVVLAEVAERDGAGAAAWDLIERLRAEDAGARPASASAALADFERAGAVVPGEPTAPLSVAGTSEATTPLAVAGAGGPTTARPAGSSPAPERRRVIAIAALTAALVAAVLGIAVALGGGGGEGGDGEGVAGSAGGPASGEQPGDGNAAKAAADPAAEESQTAPDDTAASESAGADGAALNDQGFALIQAGRYEEAIPPLEQAVDALAGSGDELTYNYALYNLAHALRMAGRPEEAIPLLQERLEYPDQQGVVAQELAAAEAAVGEAGGVPGEKRGGGPPPWAENDDGD